MCGRYAGDVRKIWGRYGGDVREMWGRYGPERDAEGAEDTPSPSLNPNPTPNPNPNPVPKARIKNTAARTDDDLLDDVNADGSTMAQVEIWRRYGGVMGEIHGRYRR